MGTEAKAGTAQSSSQPRMNHKGHEVHKGVTSAPPRPGGPRLSVRTSAQRSKLLSPSPPCARRCRVAGSRRQLRHQPLDRIRHGGEVDRGIRAATPTNSEPRSSRSTADSGEATSPSGLWRISRRASEGRMERPRDRHGRSGSVTVYRARELRQGGSGGRSEQPVRRGCEEARRLKMGRLVHHRWSRTTTDPKSARAEIPTRRFSHGDTKDAGNFRGFPGLAAPSCRPGLGSGKWAFLAYPVLHVLR